VFIYLTDVMMKYVGWEDSENSPSIHTRETQAFILQLQDVDEKYINSHAAYSRFKSIGETLLFAVGYWPESISSTKRRVRPEIGYYSKLGSTAYQKAGLVLPVKAMDGRTELMLEMSNRFQKYANVLYHVRRDIGEKDVGNIDVLMKLAYFFQDESILGAYVLHLPEQDNENIQKGILKRSVEDGIINIEEERIKN